MQDNSAPGSFSPPPAEPPAFVDTDGPNPLTTISPTLLFSAGFVLLAIYVYLVWFHIPNRQSDIAKRAVKGEGQVLIKDSIPYGDGRLVFTVQFVYPDEKKKNHMVLNQLEDQGLWEGLKTNQYVKVFYLPDNPDMAFMQGATAIVIDDPASASQRIVRVTAPNAGALSFVGTSALLASIPCWALGFINRAIGRKATPKSGRPGGKKRKGGPVMARR